MNDFDKKFRKQIQEDVKIPDNINQLFSNFESEVEKMEENKINKTNINKRFKFAYVLTWILSIIACSGIVYATIIPQEWKANLNSLINNYFGTNNSMYEEKIVGVQDQTLDKIINSDKENKEKYSQLLDADIYGIGDSNGSTMIESNYKQYNFQEIYEENETMILEKYSDKITIKMGIVNYGCVEKLDTLNTKLDENGTVVKRRESSLDETLEFQSKELKNNWNEYYYGENEFKDKLYFKITGMTLMNGNNTSEETYNDYSRAKKIKVTFNNETEEIVNLIDNQKAQFIDLSYIQYDISKPVQINIEILETYQGEKSNDTYLADIQFGMESNIPQSR